MRRCAAALRLAIKPAAFVALFALPACQFVGSPVAGAGGFIGDTHGFAFDPNRPPGGGENMDRVAGREVDVPPLLTEPGNIWPGPIPPDKSLADLQREQNQNTPPITTDAPYAPHPQPRPAQPSGNGPTSYAPPPVINTPSGSLVPSNSSGGVTTATSPGGGTSIIVPNGNGTSTVIAPDGTTQTVPAAR